MEHIVYKYYATGIFGYAEYDGLYELCNTSSIVAPNAPVMITSRNFSYMSSFDIDTTLVPGFTVRRIVSKTENKIVGTLQWLGNSTYSLLFDNMSYCIKRDCQQYVLMSEKGEKLIALNRISRDMVIPENIQVAYRGYDLLPMFEVCQYAQISNNLLSIFSAFPMLEFGL